MNPDHGQMNPSFRAGFRTLVISNQSPVSHQPGEGPFDHPPFGQDGKSLHVVGTLDDLDFKLGPMFLDPIGESLTRVAAVDPKFAQPGEPSGDLAEHFLRAVPFGATGWSHPDPEPQTQGIDEHVALAPLDSLAGIVPHLAAVPVRLDALAVQDSRRGLLTSPLFQADAGPEGIVEGGPGLVERPSTEDVMDGLPRWIGRGQEAPGNSALEHIQDGIEHQASVRGRSAQFFGLRKHGPEELPLSVGEIGIVEGVFHAPTAAAPRMEAILPSRPVN